MFFNWPQLYLLGGSDDLLAEAGRHWEGVTAQLTELGMLKDEYERGYDWFHQGESLLLLYFLTMADPARWAERAVRFAELYVDPAHGNYDPARRIIRRPHNGSDPGRTGLFDGTHYPWLDQEARCYGFPLDWLVPDGAPEPERARDPRLAGEMTARMGTGDTAVNLAAAGLVLNAWILTGDPRYRDWIEQYVGAWRERAAANDGIVPDNAGPDGVVGSLLDGRWYGGHYGWSWPHGWYSVGSRRHRRRAGRRHRHRRRRLPGPAAPRPGHDDRERQGDGVRRIRLLAALQVAPAAGRGRDDPDDAGPVPAQRPRLVRLQPDAGVDPDGPLAPRRQPGRPAAGWRNCARQAGYDWRTVRSFRSKEEAGHEEPWFAFLAGDNPDYPEKILAAAQAQVRHRLARMQAYRDTDVAEADIHLWQQCNPVVTEALVQLTWGGPQVIYNGGLQQARIRYYDAARRRPGLPASVAALVSSIDPLATVVDLVNLRPGTRPHRSIVQAGAFAEHTIEAVRYTACPDRSWLGRLYDYGHGEPTVTEHRADVRGPWLTVRLPGSTRIRLTLTLALRSRAPVLRHAVRQCPTVAR